MSLDADSDCVVVRLYEFDYSLTPEGEAALRHKESVAAEARDLARERKAGDFCSPQDAQINGAPLSLI